jgi:hypothetical protein
MSNAVFSPAFGSTISVSNSASATAAVALPKNCNAVILTNTSATARTHVILTQYGNEGDALPTGTAPTTSTGLPILPNQQVAVYVGVGPSVIRTIATAADGNIIITPANLM